MNVARILDASALEVQMRRPNQERMQLISAGRAMRTDLIVERHDLVAVICSEDGDVACVGLGHEMLDRSDDKLARFVPLERIATLQHFDLAVDDDRATRGTLE